MPYLLTGPNGYRRVYDQVPTQEQILAEDIDTGLTVADFSRAAEVGAYITWHKSGAWTLSNTEGGELAGYSPKRFPLAKYATVTDMLDAKATYFETNLREALLLLGQMAEFARLPEIQAATDGAFDPDLTLQRIDALRAGFGLIPPVIPTPAAAA